MFPGTLQYEDIHLMQARRYVKLDKIFELPHIPSIVILSRLLKLLALIERRVMMSKDG